MAAPVIADDLLILDVRDDAELELLLKLSDALLGVRPALARPGTQLRDQLIQLLKFLPRALADALTLPRLKDLVAHGKLDDLLITDHAIARPHNPWRGRIFRIYRLEFLRMRRSLGNARCGLAIAIEDPGHEPDPLFRIGVGYVRCAESAVPNDVAQFPELLPDHREIIDDRLEITSPGGLLPGVTIEKMQEGFSKIRNKALAHAFLYMNMIEEWGSGIPKLMREMKEYGLRKPEFIDLEIGFRVNLYRNQGDAGVAGSKINASTEKQKTSIENGNSDTKTSITPTNFSIENFCAGNAGLCANTEISTEPDNTSQKGDRTSAEAYPETELNDREKKLLELIRENPGITMNRMAAVCGLSKSSIRYTLDGLRSRGVITRKGSQKKGEWVIHG